MLTKETINNEQKEFIQDGDTNDYSKELDIKIISNKCEWVEYGNQLFTVKFMHAGLMYECAYVFETGPGKFDWDHYNSDCYVKVLPPKEPKEKAGVQTHLIASTSLRGMGSVHLTLKNVPDELHKRIIEKYGSYWEMFDEGHVDEYEEFLNLPDVKVEETFAVDNE